MVSFRRATGHITSRIDRLTDHSERSPRHDLMSGHDMIFLRKQPTDIDDIDRDDKGKVSALNELNCGVSDHHF